MKQKYNINQNYQPPSSEDIAKHKDFDALLKQFGETPSVEQAVPPPTKMRRLRLVAAFALAAMVAGWFFYVNLGIDPYQKANQDHFAALPFVHPPLENVPSPQFASMKINANEGGVYKHRTGSRIVIPKAAFINDKGALIEGEVDIKYREYHDFVDFFLSGIPMTYDSAGVQYILESAGMMEVYAEQNGKRVRMAPGKDLNVELVSYINMPSINVAPNYNIYKLDKDKKNWIYTDIDNITILEEEKETVELDKNSPLYSAQKNLKEELERINKEEKDQLSSLETTLPLPAAPLRPQQSNGSNTVFDLDITEQSQLEDVYDGSLWQVSPRSDVKAADMFRNADGFSVKKVNELDYELTLTMGTNAQKILVNPVLSGDAYDRAVADFDEKLAAFNRLMSERATQLAAEKEALQNKLAAARTLANANYKKALEDLKANGLDVGATDLMIRRKIVNRFKATEFGIWNCDRPLPPNVQLLQASFETNKGTKLNNHTAYLVDKSKNTVNRFLATDGAKIAFNRSSQNLLWIVTEDNKVAVFRNEDFKNVPSNASEFTFVLKEVEKHIDNEADVREVLYF